MGGRTRWSRELDRAGVPVLLRLCLGKDFFRYLICQTGHASCRINFQPHLDKAYKEWVHHYMRPLQYI